MERLLSKARLVQKKNKETDKEERSAEASRSISLEGNVQQKRSKRRESTTELRDAGLRASSKGRWLALDIPQDAHTNIIRGFFLKHGLSPKDLVYGKTIGKGTFGRVQIVTLNESLEKKLVKLRCPPLPTLAVKIMKKYDIVNVNRAPDKKHGPHYDHTRHEVALLMKINHPFIVSMYGLAQDSRKIYMLMEYACGGELFGFLSKRDRISAGMARFFAAEVVLVFEYLHSHNIVYRDLKPENILIAMDGHIKLADFGFAKKLVNRKTWTLCGTPEYIAPETIRAKGHGLGADWWGLGILLYEMLMGEPPFTGESVIQIYRMIQEVQLQRPADLDIRAWDLIKRLLVKDLSKRLGCLKDGALDIKKHIFFYEMRWQALIEKNYPAPWIPEKLSDANLDKYFDEYSDSIDDEMAISPEEQKELFNEFLDHSLAE